MPVDRKHWLSPFTKDWLNPWQCPYCLDGTLRLATIDHDEKKPIALIEKRDRASRQYNERTEWYPEEGMFAALFSCTNSSCQEVVSACGAWGTSVETDRQGYEHEYLTYLPQFLHPAPLVIRVPKKCPDAVRKEVTAASSLYWCDQSACVNRIRCAVELFLTDIGILRLTVSRGKKRHRLTLNDRITRLKDTKPDLATHLNAVRWLGNAGSHPGE